jgi:hypothetical protein
MVGTEDMTKSINSCDGKRPATKEKLRSIMEAASALTALGDEESESGSRPSSPKPNSNEASKTSAEEAKQESSSSAKRYLPEHKKPDAAPTFPEKVRGRWCF